MTAAAVDNVLERFEKDAWFGKPQDRDLEVAGLDAWAKKEMLALGYRVAIDTSRLDLAPNSLTYTRSLTLRCVSVEFGGPVSSCPLRRPWSAVRGGSRRTAGK